MEHIDMKNRLDSKLKIYSICSFRIRSRKRDIFEKPLQHNSNPSVACLNSLKNIASTKKTNNFVKDQQRSF